MRDIIKPTVTLFVTCVFITVCLALTYSSTKGQIDARAAADSENSRKEVLSQAESFKEIEGYNQVNKSMYVKDVYQGISGNKTAGYVVTVMSKGYGGMIEVVVGVDGNGSTSGVKIASSSETPGLGLKAGDKPFISQFLNQSDKEKLSVVKGKKSKNTEIEAISGATITSRAVTEAVQTAINTAGELSKKEGAKK